MKIAILGGTGDIGEGLALRWGIATDHEILIGSRTPEKASEAADSYRTLLSEHTDDVLMSGNENAIVTEDADVVVLATPPEYVTSLTREIAGALKPSAILVSPAVKLHGDKSGFHRDTASDDSLTARVGAAAPPDVSVVGAFHSLAAGRLATLDAPLDMDTLVVGDDPAAKETMIGLIDEIEGLRALDAGPLANAPEVEAMTPLCINVALHNDGMHDVGVRFM